MLKNVPESNYIKRLRWQIKVLQGGAIHVAPVAEKVLCFCRKNCGRFHSDNIPAGLSCTLEKGSGGTANVE